MEQKEYTTKEAILKRAQEIIGIPLRLLDKTGRLSTGKGGIGTMIEENVFGYTPNSNAEPDFPEAGVELKVTPFVRSKKGISAKERLVCNIIDYMQEYDKVFRTSAFWKKCNTMLLMSYEFLRNTPKGDFSIAKAILFSFPAEDLLIIEKDWETIITKVRAGKAHELSEGDTLYLAACPKGASSASVRQQPFSNIPAMQRAYSLKSTYMTIVLRNYIFGEMQDENIIKDWHDLAKTSFEQYVIDKVSPYYGQTQAELKAHFGITNSPKNLNEILLARMLGVQGRIGSTSEFQKAGIVPKTIRVRKGGVIRESMSFPAFDFLQLSQENEWEESALYNYLAPAKFLFVIFQEDDNGSLVFQRIKFWNISNDALVEVRKVWERTAQTIRKGVELTPTPQGTRNNLPKKAESPVAHVRPHARNANDMLPLLDGRMMTRQCFWLNNDFIAQQIKE